MTKGEFIDEVASAPGCPRRTPGQRSTPCSRRSRHAEEGWRRRLHRLRQVPRHEALGAHWREPAEPGSEGPDPGGDRAEVLRGLDAEGRRPRLAGCRRWRPATLRTYVRMAGRTPPPRGPRARAAPARAGSGRPAGRADRGERRAARSRARRGRPAGAAARAGRARAPRARGGRARRRAPRASRRRPGRPRRPGAAAEHAAGRGGLDGRRPRDDGRRARARASSRSAPCASRAASRSATLSRLVDPGIPMPPRISQLTGIRDRDLARRRPAAPGASPSCSRSPAAASSSPTTRPSTSACSIARSCGSTARGSACACSTPSRWPGACWPGASRASTCASVSERFDVTVRPCHRALPDAQATAEVLLALIGLAQERGAETRRGRAWRWRWRRRGARASGGTSRRACPPGRASTSCATAWGRRSTSARPATCARACARTSARAGSRRASRARWRRWRGSTPRPRGRSSRPRSSSSI